MEADCATPRAGLKLLDRYTLDRKIAKGGFSSVWAVTDSQSKLKVAAKCVQDPMHNSMREAEIYRDLSSEEGFAEYYDYCIQDNCFFILLERLNRDLFYAYRSKREKFTEEYIYGLGVQMFERIESLHKLGYVHRDLKPSQFMFKRSSHLLYLIDFNLARKYPKTFAYISQHKGGLVGNVTYASLSAHTIEQQTRRDDCESILYILLYFLKGSLPWQGLLEKGREQIGLVASIKSKTPITELCRGLPVEFSILLNRARSMTFEETPDYPFFKATLQSLHRKFRPTPMHTLDATPSSSGLYSLSNTSLMSVSIMSFTDASPDNSPIKLDSGIPTDTSLKVTDMSPKPKSNRFCSLLKKPTKKLKRNLPKGINREALLRSKEFFKESESEEDLPPCIGEGGLMEVKEELDKKAGNCLMF
mmetsp:Transcript_10540/g.20263  ORF Transcript_10540/g.20263 Transcript_10540/m.20263 type:complete len:417 (-) Transcript_10540:22-1272(-)